MRFREARITEGRICFLATLAFVVLIGGCSKPIPPNELFENARQSLEDDDFANVINLVDQLPDDFDQWQAAMLLAGEAAFGNGQPEKALEYYYAAADRDLSATDGQLALFSAGEIHFYFGRLSMAERDFLRLLEQQPGNLITNERMAFIMSFTGRRWRALDHYFKLIRSGDASYRELALAADVGRPIEEFDYLEKCRETSPDDVLVQMAEVTLAYQEGEPNAIKRLTRFTNAHPEYLSTQAMLGELLVDQDDEQFIKWHRGLPQNRAQSADLWFVRGLWARKQSDLELSAACLQYCLSQIPFHRRAYYLYGQVLTALEDERAGPVIAYSQKLIELSQTIDKVLLSEGNSPKHAEQAANLLVELGRIWEACAWGVYGRNRFPGATWPQAIFDQHAHKLTPELPRIETERDPLAGIEPAGAPDFETLVARVSQGIDNKVVSSGPDRFRTRGIRFIEYPVIDFTYYNADDPQTKGRRTFEQTGGGVGIVDYDVDGYPDVLLPQGTTWRTGDDRPIPNPQLRDGLFRNLDGLGFVEASTMLTGPDSGYGQGCGVGDFNNDGLPDLYVANVGRNCLYENMGDGTFLNVTDRAGLNDDSWTTSVMVCDLNADGRPDLYDVNYLSGEDLYQRICQGLACSPGVFPAARDRVWINRGDGRFVLFEDATPIKNSKSLGIVAFELETKRRPCLFIANDQVANHFLMNRSAGNQFDLELRNEALVSGLAFNDDGLPMACMGVTAADFDSNGALDLFVTNFLNEPNTLYQQDTRGLFLDATRASGLYAVSMDMTGWGTQALDAQLDGLMDLVITNGHVDDYREQGGPFGMRPQFLENRGSRFVERRSETLGPWFAQEIQGRGLARVDWNADGLPEFIVSNINTPVSLLANQTAETGNFIRIDLRATRTARDAIGTRVIVETEHAAREQQLLAGDGYMASNERSLQFGLAETTDVRKLTVNWPSGARSVIENPPLNRRLIIVEELPLATSISENEHASIAVILEDGES